MTIKDKIYVAINGIERGLEDDDTDKIEVWRDNLNKNIDDYLYDEYKRSREIKTPINYLDKAWYIDASDKSVFVSEGGDLKRVSRTKEEFLMDKFEVYISEIWMDKTEDSNIRKVTAYVCEDGEWKDLEGSKTFANYIRENYGK